MKIKTNIMETTLTRIRKSDLQKIKVLSSRLGISNVTMFGYLIANYQTVNSIKDKELKPITLNCTKKGIKVKRSRSKNQSYKFVPERILTGEKR